MPPEHRRQILTVYLTAVSRQIRLPRAGISGMLLNLKNDGIRFTSENEDSIPFTEEDRVQ